MPLSGWWRTSGVSAWSPDGRFVLAGVTETPSIFVTLAAIEVITGSVFEIARLEVGAQADLGSDYFWIMQPVTYVGTVLHKNTSRAGIGKRATWFF